MFKLKKDPPKPAPPPVDKRRVAQDIVQKLLIQKQMEKDAAGIIELAKQLDKGYYGPFPGNRVLHVFSRRYDQLAYGYDFKPPNEVELIQVVDL